MKPSELRAQRRQLRQRIDQIKADPLLVELNQKEEEEENLRKQHSDLINSVGVKIRSLRESGKLTGQDFIDFRNGIYRLDEDDREAAVDAKVQELGL